MGATPADDDDVATDSATCSNHAVSFPQTGWEAPTAGVQLALSKTGLIEADARAEASSPPKKGVDMNLPRSRWTAAASAAFLITWAAAGPAQQSPGSNAPTPNPAPEGAPAMSTTSASALQEPVIEPTTRSSSVPNKALLVTGVVLLGGAYGASAVAAGVSDRESEDKLYYPVVGPWLALNDRDCGAEHCANKTLNTVLLVGSGVVQGVGALSVLMSLVIPEKTTHSWYLIGDEQRPNLALSPVLGQDQVGAFAVGQF
jgi:hypothetical protein